MSGDGNKEDKKEKPKPPEQRIVLDEKIKKS